MSGTFAAPLVTVTATLDSNAAECGDRDPLGARAGRGGELGQRGEPGRPGELAADGGGRTGLRASSLSTRAGRTRSGRETAIRFDVPQSGRVLLEVFDVNGRRLRTLVDGVLSPGPKALAWDGTDDGRTAGRAAASTSTGCARSSFEATRKMTLLR